MMLKASLHAQPVSGAAKRGRASTVARPVVRVQAQKIDEEVLCTQDLLQSPGVSPVTAPKAGVPQAQAQAAAVSDFQMFGATQEAINGRAAMLGFVAAAASEALTHQAVWSQIAGKYINMELIEKPIGVATLGFGAIVCLVTMATLVPKFVAGAEVDSRSFGPFTPALEKTLGRVAMMGFGGLIITELVKGSALL